MTAHRHLAEALLMMLGAVLLVSLMAYANVQDVVRYLGA